MSTGRQRRLAGGIVTALALSALWSAGGNEPPRSPRKATKSSTPSVAL